MTTINPTPTPTTTTTTTATKTTMCNILIVRRLSMGALHLRKWLRNQSRSAGQIKQSAGISPSHDMLIVKIPMKGHRVSKGIVVHVGSNWYLGKPLNKSLPPISNSKDGTQCRGSGMFVYFFYFVDLLLCCYCLYEWIDTGRWRWHCCEFLWYELKDQLVDYDMHVYVYLLLLAGMDFIFSTHISEGYFPHWHRVFSSFEIGYFPLSGREISPIFEGTLCFKIPP
jgi:hypothetical protein